MPSKSNGIKWLKLSYNHSLYNKTSAVQVISMWQKWCRDKITMFVGKIVEFPIGPACLKLYPLGNGVCVHR